MPDPTGEKVDSELIRMTEESNYRARLDSLRAEASQKKRQAASKSISGRALSSTLSMRSGGGASAAAMAQDFPGFQDNSQNRTSISGQLQGARNVARQQVQAMAKKEAKRVAGQATKVATRALATALRAALPYILLGLAILGLIFLIIMMVVTAMQYAQEYLPEWLVEWGINLAI
jgi:hypothetical protein